MVNNFIQLEINIKSSLSFSQSLNGRNRFYHSFFGFVIMNLTICVNFEFRRKMNYQKKALSTTHCACNCLYGVDGTIPINQ